MASKLLLILGITLCVCSCGTIKEEIWIYPDQKAELEFSMELGKEMSDPFSSSLSSLLGNFSGGDSSSLQPKITGNFTIMGLPVNNEEMAIDTTLFLKGNPEIRYDSILQQIVALDSTQCLSETQQAQFAQQLHNLLTDSRIRFRNNVPGYFMVFSLKTGKTDLQELYSLGNYMKMLMADGKNNLQKKESFLFRLEKNSFKRGQLAFWQDIFSLAGDNSGNMDFIQIFLNKMKMKEFVSIVHLPGKIKSVTNPVSILSADRKTATTTLTREELDQGKSFESIIKFK